MQKSSRIRLLAVVGVLALLAACGSDDEGGGGGATGKVKVTGSSTVEPISSAAAEAFQGENGDVQIAVSGPGTSDGFKQFCAGEADIADASRPIKEEEITACKDGGIEYIELKVGFDGMSVLTAPDNPLECVNFADLYALLGPESEDVDQWSKAADLATELGSDTEFPDLKLDPTGPGEESGTYDSFIEIAFADIAEKRVEEGKLDEAKVETTRANYQSSPNDNTIIQNIEGSDGSLGWVGFAFAEDAGDAVKELQVSAEPGGECVAPDAETIADASYPLSRSLYIYVDKAKATEGSAVTAFVDFYLESLPEFVEAGGYVNLPEDQVAATNKTWTDKKVGTQEAS
ncbi:MAG: substrate-binding domain-containing protein [Acidimicrobiales bacterium]